MRLVADDDEEVLSLLNHPSECCLYHSSLVAIDGYTGRAVVEFKLEARVRIPCLEQPLVVYVLAVVVANKDFFLGHRHFPYTLE